MENNKKYYSTAAALYVTYFILGIAVTIMSQFKQDFAALWGASVLADGTYDVSGVVTVIAAVGLGRLVAFPVAGPFSDKFGRRKSALVGMALFAVFFAGITYTRSTAAAYLLILLSGMANSFLDTCVTPCCMEIFSKNGSIANLFTKFSVSVGQFLLPLLILVMDTQGLHFRALFLLGAALVIVDAILIAILPFPPMAGSTQEAGAQKSNKMKITPALILLTCISFTSSATFMIFMNCNQELGILYGLSNPQLIQSFYSTGIVVAVLLTSLLVKRGLKPIKVLMLYPFVAFFALLLMYLIRTPQMCLAGGFLIGYFAAGGVLQLATSTANEMYPNHKGRITAIVMFASAASNYITLNVAARLSAAGGAEGPRHILLFNMAVTAVGVLLALALNVHLKKEEAKTCQSDIH